MYFLIFYFTRIPELFRIVKTTYHFFCLSSYSSYVLAIPNFFENMESYNSLIQFLLGLTALLGLIFATWKIYKPNLDISMISFYHTILINKELACVLKVKTDSAVDIIINNIRVYALQKNGTRILMEIMYIRQKAFIPKMRDFQGKDAIWKLIKPLEPDLRIHGIKSGVNEYYMSLKSEKPISSESENDQIIFWEFEIKGRSPLSFVPRFFPMLIPLCKVDHPKQKDLYFEDSLIIKITEEEKMKLISEL